MSTENLRVFPEIVPPSSDAPRGRDIVEDLAARVAELRVEWTEDQGLTPSYARALLAAQQEIARVRPELWREVADPLDEQWLQEVIAAHGPRLAAEADRPWDRIGWQSAAEELEASYFAEELPDPMERAALARELIEELDEVELAALAIERVRHESSALAEEATKAASWLAAHPDTFLAAGTFVRATSESFRPDLETYDPDLALTAEKYLRILECVVDAEAAVTFAALR